MDVAADRDVRISDRETVETIIRKRASSIDNRPTMKALKHVERKKLIEAVRRLDKVLPDVEIKDITELNDTIRVCT